MWTRKDGAPDVITAKWKTSLDAKEEHYGTVKLGDDFRIELPMLDSPGSIATGTTVFWGLTDHLERCTVVTLPIKIPSFVSSAEGGIFSSRAIITQLLS